MKTSTNHRPVRFDCSGVGSYQNKVRGGIYNHSDRNTVKPAKKTKITKHLLIKSRESLILFR
jgi:hypothetical protein